jgi:hypothetical protein
MKSKRLLILSALLLGASIHAGANELGIKRGTMFLDARKVLLKAGWKGIILHKDPSDDSDSANYLDEQARPYYKLGVHEVDSCAGGAHPTCLFHYRKKDECLTVVTYGETPHDSFVTHWLNTCGD